ncbi:MAG: allophanate hydrolase [Hyphomonadaceae bacterium]
MSAAPGVRSVAQAVAAHPQSVSEIAEAALAARDAYDRIQPQIWIERVSPEAVRTAARTIAARLEAGEKLPLAGVPFAVKDNLDIAGMATTAACPAFAYTPARNAAAVQKLLDAGALLIGKTNLDQFATGLVGARSPYGACGCAYDREYISGGSSSGSAIAVAAGVVPFALGTDTAGSGRVPAAFNHLVGLKPTKGRWSTAGLVPACRSLDCVSVFTRNAGDAALIDAVLTGFDAADPFSRLAPPPARFPQTPRIGVPRPDQLDFSGDTQSGALYAAACARAEKLGAVQTIDIAPLLACAQLLYQGPWVAERTAALAPLLARNPGAIHPVVRAIVEAGAGVSAVAAFEGLYALKGYERAAAALWAQIDVLLLPTAPTIYRIADVEAEPFALNANLGRYTNFVNLLDMAAIALPAGARANGTGFGITFIAPAWADDSLLALAERYEELEPMNEPPPLDLKERNACVELAVVGAHLHGMPLHWQLASRNARLVRRCKTAPSYKLYAMLQTTPPKPALVHVGENGAPIEVEVYELSLEAFGSFVAEVPAPLAIGTVTLEDGADVKGFVAEPRALNGAEEITRFGGWRAFMAQRA